jgi:hypothetical protein
MGFLRTLRFWAGCLASWALLSLTEGTALHVDAVRAGRESALATVLLDRAASDVIWVGIVAAVFAAMQRTMATRASAAQITKRSAALGLVLAPVAVVWGPLARAAVHGGGVAAVVDGLLETAGTTLIWVAFLYSMTALAACVVLVSQRSRRQERDGIELRARLAQAELELLRGQLEPHFLFNALNTVAGLIRVARHDLATTALARLSELLRYVVEASRQARVPLAWELEFATSYLELQQLRFGPRLQFVIHAAPVTRACEVPPLLLQPLIENAVVHGVARTSDPVTIAVRVVLSDAGLQVVVDNTHDEHAPAGGDTTGVGLRNTRQRLERMYGDGFVLDAGPDGADRYRVTIALPQLAGPA